MSSSEPFVLPNGVPTQDQLDQAQARLEGIIQASHIEEDRWLSGQLGSQVFLVQENQQVTGSFKVRGASNAVGYIAERTTLKSIVTTSSGNHGAACAFAAQRYGFTCHVVMPDIARESKVKNVLRFGGLPRLVPEAKRQGTVKEIVSSIGAVEVHPYAAKHVVAGQGTLGLEILGALEGVDLVVAPIGGGGLSAGLSLALSRRTNIDLLVVEPQLASDAWALVHGREPDLSRAHESVADGLRSLVGPQNLARLLEYGARFSKVSEEQIGLAWERLLKLGYPVEPSASIGVAALLSDPEIFRELSIAVVLTGGNVDWGEDERSDSGEGDAFKEVR